MLSLICKNCNVDMEIPSQIRITKEGDKEDTRMPTVYRCPKCGHSEYKDYVNLK